MSSFSLRGVSIRGALSVMGRIFSATASVEACNFFSVARLRVVASSSTCIFIGIPTTQIVLRLRDYHHNGERITIVMVYVLNTPTIITLTITTTKWMLPFVTLVNEQDTNELCAINNVIIYCIISTNTARSRIMYNVVEIISYDCKWYVCCVDVTRPYIAVGLWNKSTRHFIGLVTALKTQTLSWSGIIELFCFYRDTCLRVLRDTLYSYLIIVYSYSINIISTRKSISAMCDTFWLVYNQRQYSFK